MTKKSKDFDKLFAALKGNEEEKETKVNRVDYKELSASSREELKKKLVEVVKEARKNQKDGEEIMVMTSQGTQMSIDEFEKNIDNEIDAIIRRKRLGLGDEKEEKSEKSRVFGVPRHVIRNFERSRLELFEEMYSDLLDSVAGFYEGTPKIETLQNAMKLALVVMASMRDELEGSQNKATQLGEAMSMFIGINPYSEHVFVAKEYDPTTGEVIGRSVLGVSKKDTIKKIQLMIDKAPDLAHREAAKKALYFFEKQGGRILN